MNVISFEFTLDLRNVHWWLYDLAGVYLYVGDHALTSYDFTTGHIPAGMTGYVNLKATKRTMFDKCIDRFRFDASKHVDTPPDLRQ